MVFATKLCYLSQEWVFITKINDVLSQLLCVYHKIFGIYHKNYGIYHKNYGIYHIDRYLSKKYVIYHKKPLIQKFTFIQKHEQQI